jgi:hypothetical protein
MAVEANISLRIDKIPKNRIVKGKPIWEDGELVTPYYFKMTVSIEDESTFKEWSDWGYNIKCWAWQSREERIVKRPKTWLGYGSVHWTDGIIKKVLKKLKTQK